MWALGVKEVWEVPKPLDRVIHTLGWPLRYGAKWHEFGGSWIYPMGENRVSLGFVVGLDYTDATVSPHDVLQQFKTSKLVRGILEGGKRVAWGAKAIPEGGYWAMPRPVAPGMAICGDGAGMVNVPILKGIHYAIHAGILAAETIFEQLKAGSPDFSAYAERVEGSLIGKELYRSRNMKQPFSRGFFVGGAIVNAMVITGGRFPGGRWRNHRDADSPMVVGDKRASAYATEPSTCRNRGGYCYGRRVLEGTSENLTPVILELGGKDPLIVCDDADLDQAVAGAMSGVFIAAGQMCLAAERVYVMDGIYDRFVSAVVKEVSALRQGDPLQGGGAQMPASVDVGAMTMPGQVDIVERLVNDALAKGAKALVGGHRDRSRPGQFFQPTVLTGVTHDMEILTNECFGPVMCILRTRDDEDAIRLANDSGFGLGSTVFSKDHERARRIADRLVAGSTCINDYGLCYMANALPFGGVKQSGFGRLNGREGLRACCNIKSVLPDRFPLHLPAKIYPVRSGDYEMVHATVNLLYRRANLSGLRARAQALSFPAQAPTDTADGSAQIRRQYPPPA